jgi:hypothetical protein
MAKFFGTYHYVDVPDDVAETEYGAGLGQKLVVVRKDVYDALWNILENIPVIESELLENAGADISDLLEVEE